MQNEKINAPQMVREYKIGNTTYVVKSHSRPDATEDAVSKVKRLIRNDLRKKSANDLKKAALCNIIQVIITYTSRNCNEKIRFLL